MAALTFRAAPANDNTHTVTRSTGDSISTATAAIIVDSTKTKIEVMDAVRAILRQLNRQNAKTTAPADIATTGSDVE